MRTAAVPPLPTRYHASTLVPHCRTAIVGWAKAAEAFRWCTAKVPPLPTLSYIAACSDSVGKGGQAQQVDQGRPGRLCPPYVDAAAPSEGNTERQHGQE